MIPWRFKDAVRRLIDSPACHEAASRNAMIEKAPTNEPVIGFGGVLQADGLVHGGAVKLLSLRDGFRHDEIRFNILYLVSSSQPRFAEDLVRVCRARGIKFVWNQNGVGYSAWAGRETERHNAPMRRIRSQADFVVYQSRFCRGSADEFLGPCSAPSEILLNPVDTKIFLPRSEYLPAKPLRLLAIGTQNYPDRVLSALDCLRVLRNDGVDCALTIAGPMIWKHAERDVGELIASMQLRDSVTILPPFDQNEAAGIYQAHHILLHPKYMDPCPTVVAEALSCGLPVVASKSGGIPEMVDNDCAALIDVPMSWERLATPSGRELADSVKLISHDLSARSRAARLRAECLFGQEQWLARHAQIFRSLVLSS